MFPTADEQHSSKLVIKDFPLGIPIHKIPEQMGILYVFLFFLAYEDVYIPASKGYSPDG